jgi:hypothetical protein
MANDRDFEDVLLRHPEIIKDELRLIGRNGVVCGRRIDGVPYATASEGARSGPPASGTIPLLSMQSAIILFK